MAQLSEHNSRGLYPRSGYETECCCDLEQVMYVSPWNDCTSTTTGFGRGLISWCLLKKMKSIKSSQLQSLGVSQHHVCQTWKQRCQGAENVNIKVDVFKEFFLDMSREVLILTLAGLQFYNINICRLLGVYTANHESLIVNFKLLQLLRVPK